MNPASHGNSVCYARSLNDCYGSVSGEHVVSKSLLKEIWPGENEGLVSGLTFLKPSRQHAKTLGINSLTANILCAGHNSRLSPFDGEITKLFRASEYLFKAEHNGYPVAANKYINGDYIERWMLKTLCNGLYSGNFPVPFLDSFKGQVPDNQKLSIIYCGDPFPCGWGVFVTCGGNPVNAENVFQLEVVGAPEGVVGLRMRMMGCQFTLVLSDNLSPFPELAQAIYRPTRIIASQTRNATVFSWAASPGHSSIEFSVTDPPPKAVSPGAV